MRFRLRPDPLLIVVALLLALTLALYFTGVFVYPFGLLILSVIFVGRIMALSVRNDRK